MTGFRRADLEETAGIPSSGYDRKAILLAEQAFWPNNLRLLPRKLTAIHFTGDRDRGFLSSQLMHGNIPYRP